MEIKTINKILEDEALLLPIPVRNIICKKINEQHIPSAKAISMEKLHNRSSQVTSFYRPISKIAFTEKEIIK